MTQTILPVQTQYTTLAGSGCSSGATSIILTSFKDILEANLVMASFGLKGYMTLEPSNSSQEEQISFSGITQNANGTATLTGVKTVLFISPFTETSGTRLAHPGGSKAVVSNTAAFYNALASELNTETVTGLWTFPSVDTTRARIGADTDTAVATAFVTLGQLSRQAISGASDASTTVKGIVELATQNETDTKSTTGSTGALLVVTPDKLRATKYNDYVLDTGTSTAYAIAPSPIITVYVAGQEFTFKAKSTSGATPTLNVNGVGAKSLFRGTAAAGARTIITHSVIGVVYDGTNMQIKSVSKPMVSQEGCEIYGTSSGVGTAYAVGLSPALTAYVAGLTVRFSADTASAGGATLNVNSLGAKTIKRGGISQLINTDIPANQVVQVVYDGTDFHLQNSLNTVGKIATNTTQVSVTGTTSATPIVSVYLPGLILGISSAVRITVPISQYTSQINKKVTVSMVYGTTTVGSVSFTSTAILSLTGKIEAILMGAGTTGSQKGYVYMSLGTGTATGAATDITVSNAMGSGTSSVDSTARQPLQIVSTADDNGNVLTQQGYLIERIS